MHTLLYITTRFPSPLITGDRLRAYYSLRALSRYFDIDLAVLEDPGHVDVRKILPFVNRVFYFPQAPLQRIWSFFRGVGKGLPLQVALYTNPLLKNYIKMHASRYQMVFCHLIRTAAHIEEIKTPKLLDYCDSYSLLHASHQQYGGWRRLYSFFEYPATRKYEKKICEEFDHCLVINERDKRWLIGMSEVSPKKLSILSPFIKDEFLLQRLKKNQDAFELIFFGNLKYYPNVDAIVHFVRVIYPEVHKQIPSVRLFIVGADPARSVRLLHSEKQQIYVTGYVENISEYISRATIAIAPLRIAAGSQNKIVEAMALGTPVVASVVAAEGIDFLTPDLIVTQNTDITMANAIVELLGDPARRKKMGGKGREYIANHMLQKNFDSQLENIISKLPS